MAEGKCTRCDCELAPCGICGTPMHRQLATAFTNAAQPTATSAEQVTLSPVCQCCDSIGRKLFPDGPKVN